MARFVSDSASSRSPIFPPVNYKQYKTFQTAIRRKNLQFHQSHLPRQLKIRTHAFWNFLKSERTHLSSSFRLKLISAKKFNKFVDPMDTGSRMLYFKNGSSRECLLIRKEQSMSLIHLPHILITYISLILLTHIR